MTIYDCVVVGSGCSGAMAAQTLVENGTQVTMLDVGSRQSPSTHTIPDKDYLSLRKTDADQYKYLIGEAASGVGWGKTGKGEQITPPRKHIIDSVEKLIPTSSTTFSPLESLGYGGLGIGWGLQCWKYSDSDLEATGLNANRMRGAYQVVSDRIGISATNDDAAPYTIGNLKSYDPSPIMDRNHQLLLSRYSSRKSSLNERGFYMGRTPLALITRDRDDRKKYAYRDMDFYSDLDLSAWRPWITVDRLKKLPNFTYIGGHLVTKFVEKKDWTEIYCLTTTDNKEVVLRCRRLVLASSALGSARIVLRSLGTSKSRLPLLCNPYSYVPAVQPKFIGHAAEARKLGFTQLSLFYDPAQENRGASVASLYSYQSLMLFRIIRHVPLDFRDAIALMRYLLPSLVIMGIHHPDAASPDKLIRLVENKNMPTGDMLQIAYRLSETEKVFIGRREKALIKTARKIGLHSVKRIDPGFGASIHYAGTLPFSKRNQPFSLHPSGRLHGSRSVYVADSAGFNYLPAPGLTFSLMANAHLVAENVLKHGE